MRGHAKNLNPYDHHRNGLAERAVRDERETVEKFVRTLTEGEDGWKEKWVELLPMVRLAINTREPFPCQKTKSGH